MECGGKSGTQKNLLDVGRVEFEPTTEAIVLEGEQFVNPCRSSWIVYLVCPCCTSENQINSLY